jgi:hypothetical protein
MVAISKVSATGVNRGAVLSDEPCPFYRYRLWREWSDGPRCVFVGINPSTADAIKDDATIRKCIGFAQRWGFGSLDMINLFAWRDTDQLALLKSVNPIGPDNDMACKIVFETASRVVWAWGRGKSAAVRKLIDDRVTDRRWQVTGCEVGTLGLTDDGYPCHPLMLAYSTRFQP